MTVEEKTIKSEIIYKGKILNLRKDKVTVKNGTSYREIIEHNGGAVTVPITKKGEIVLVKQYRKAAGRVLLEIPAGKIDPGEEPEHAAIRELREETGYRAGKVEHLIDIYPTPGYCEEILYIYFATDLESGETDFDENEAIDIVLIPFADAVSLVKSGEIMDAKTITGILLAENLMTGDVIYE